MKRTINNLLPTIVCGLLAGLCAAVYVIPLIFPK
jgi:hypothetical protein